MAQRPVGAAHAGAGGAHDDADGDEQHRRDDGGRGELLEPGHGRGFDLGREWVGRGGERRRHSTRSRGRSRAVVPADSRVPGYALRMPRSLAAMLVLLAAVVVGCASVCADRRPVASSAAGKPSVIPVIVSSQQAVGPNRFVFSFLDPTTNLPAASPDRTASVAFIPPGQTEPGPAVPATFVWAIEGSRGDYVAMTDVPHDRRLEGRVHHPGAEHAPGGDRRRVHGARQGHDRRRRAAGPVDHQPDGRGRRRRPRDDLERRRTPIRPSTRRPSRTPWRRTSRSCSCSRRRRSARAPSAARPSTGSRRPRRPRPRTSRSSTSSPTSSPTPTASSSPSSTRTASSRPVDASNQWGLVSEPWIFTVGADGIVKGSFEGVVGDAELKAAIADIAGG